MVIAQTRVRIAESGAENTGATDIHLGYWVVFCMANTGNWGGAHLTVRVRVRVLGFRVSFLRFKGV